MNQLNFKENETNNKDVYESPLISGFFYSQREIIEGKELFFDWLIEEAKKGYNSKSVYVHSAYVLCFYSVFSKIDSYS